MQTESKVQAFCEKLYKTVIQKAVDEISNEEDVRGLVQKEFKKCQISYSKIKKIVRYNKSDFIQDLVQIFRDIRLVNSTKNSYVEKLHQRAKLHFGQQHYQNLKKTNSKSSALKQTLSMYQHHKTQWKEEIVDNILQRTVYIIELTKGNGVLIDNQTIVTCAHVFMDEEGKQNFKYRCFITAKRAYGFIKISQSSIFPSQDIAFETIIFCGNNENALIKQITFSDELKFSQNFSKIRCIQLGLLFNNEPNQENIKVFESAEGFIEQNLFKSQTDFRLQNQMGLLIHDCYGLWGTSGSPLFDANGHLIGIHNAWNENGYGISMIVRDTDENEKIRVVKQYERRAVASHVIKQFWQKWKNIKQTAQTHLKLNSGPRKKIKAA